MDKVTERHLLRSYQDQWAPHYSGSIYQWAKENVKLPVGLSRITGEYDVNITPFLKAIFDDFLDPTVRQINAISCTQKGRSLCMQICLLFFIVNDPDTTLMIATSGDMSDTFVKQKIYPLIKGCKVVESLLTAKNSLTLKGISLPNNIEIKFTGTTPKGLVGVSCKLLLMDEVWRYESGTVSLAKARTKSYEDNCKIFICSQPGWEGDDLSIECNSGQVFEWAWCCPQCKKDQPYYWNEAKPESTKEKPVYAGIQWKPIYKADGKKDLEATAKTARLDCFYCTHSIAGSDADARRKISDGGKYLLVKDGDPTIRTRTYNAFASIRTDFAKEVLRYLNADEIKKQTGNTDQLRYFWHEVLGKEWPKYEPLNISNIITHEYDPMGTWADEAYRFMGCDIQQTHDEKWYAIRAFAKNGESRGITQGHCHSWDELQGIAKLHKIRPQNLLVDSGWNTLGVYAESVRRAEKVLIRGREQWIGWTCTKGFDKADFQGKDGIRKYFQESWQDPNLKGDVRYAGRKARLLAWCNKPIWTILNHLKSGKGAKWSINTNDAEYLKQINAWQLESVIDEKTGIIKERKWVQKCNDDHLWDAEALTILAAYIAGILGNYSVPSS